MRNFLKSQTGKKKKKKKKKFNQLFKYNGYLMDTCGTWVMHL